MLEGEPEIEDLPKLFKSELVEHVAAFGYVVYLFSHFFHLTSELVKGFSVEKNAPFLHYGIFQLEGFLILELNLEAPLLESVRLALVFNDVKNLAHYLRTIKLVFLASYKEFLPVVNDFYLNLVVFANVIRLKPGLKEDFLL